MIQITDFGPGTSSYSGKDSEETVTVTLDGRELVLTFAELKRFVKMTFSAEVKKEEPTPTFPAMTDNGR